MIQAEICDFNGDGTLTSKPANRGGPSEILEIQGNAMVGTPAIALVRIRINRVQARKLIYEITQWLGGLSEEH